MVTFVDDVDISKEDTDVIVEDNAVDNLIGETGILGETVIDGSNDDIGF